MFRRRSSDGAGDVDCGYGEVSQPGDASAGAADLLMGEESKASSDSDWPDDASDKESLQSWAKEQQEKEKQEDDLLGTKEEQHLKRWFLIITFLLLLVGVGVSLFTFYYLKGQEEETFERAFANTAQAIVDGADHRMKVIQQALLGRSQSLTTFATFTGSFWPFVSIPDWYVSGNNFLLETETEMVAWGPLVKTNASIRAWESYSTYMLENSGWFPPAELEDQLQKQLQGLDVQKQQQEEESKNTDGEDEEEEPPDLEFSDAGGLYIPLWQLSPWWYNAWINHNLTSQFEDSITLLLRTKRPIWTRFVNINNPYNSSTNYADYNMIETITVDEINDNITTTTTTTTTTATQPSSSAEAQANQSVVVSFLFQPVFRAFRDHDVSYDNLRNITSSEDDVVAIYLAAVQWDSFLGSLVPEGTPGVDMVVTNPWGQTLTYQVSTDNEGRVTTSSTLVGSGDQHSSDYEDISTSTNIAENFFIPQNPTQAHIGLSVTKSVLTTRHPHSVEELKDHGYSDTDPLMMEARQSAQQSAAAAEFSYTGIMDMTIFPTSDFENAYTTMEPLILTLVVAALTLIAIFSFFLYSRSVYDRQQKLLETANRTALVVKSLFPSNVRDRIMKEAEELEVKNQVKAKKKKLQHKVSQQMDGSHSVAGSVGGGSTSGHVGGRTSGGSFLGGLSVGSVGSRYSRRASPGNTRESQSREFPTSRKTSLGAENPYGSQPIADHFSATTVLFADMVGFTAWSSLREPVQVFTLLETIYHAFDKVARKRGIFKVETIGDCYVAVCGLPVPRPNHAIAMAYFATDCLRKMNTLTKKLEVTLGPDTGELAMRIGLHSGPVTAGVLRGEKSRFQLFGDTVNTAARMESNGKKDCIHVSEATAKLLMEHGKSRWLTLREDRVVAKGKGEMMTYWLEVRSSLANYIENTGSRRSSDESGGAATDLDGSSTDDSNSDLEPKTPEFERAISAKIVSQKLGDRVQRLVDWNVEQLVKLLKKVVANRKDTESSGVKGSDFDLRRDSSSSIRGEVTEVIPFPKPSVVDILVGNTQAEHEHVDLDPDVVAQLHKFMTVIAELYNDNAFHNFAHASHVAMACFTWLSRITSSPSDPQKENVYEAKLSGDWKIQSSPSKDMYALQADPLTHFALVFAALIHDLDHTGVPNAQLVKEKSHTASVYTTSIHEQGSVDSAFDTLMEDKYTQLRDTLFATEEEFYRFRQIVINSVMATDILDEKIMAKQFVRWGCLFLGDEEDDTAYYSDYEPENEGDQKMSIVVERMLLISDIAHTMQHWYVYRKWNSKLFEENFLAWKAGRAETDPSLTWYDDELVFFDTYVIPLATKMKDCELFDASAEECIAYATSNREQWKNRGKEEVASMVESCSEIEFEVKDSYNPIQDGKIYSPANGRPRPNARPNARPQLNKKSGMDVSMATFDTVLNSTRRR